MLDRMGRLLIGLYCLAATHALAADPVAPLLEGRWVSVQVTNHDENFAIGVGWVLRFFKDGTYRQEIDLGFGIREESGGKFRLEGHDLFLRPTSSNGEQRLGISRTRLGFIVSRPALDGKVGCAVVFVRSEKLHSELANLPSWPRTKSEAISIPRRRSTLKS
jgi:hypothetical protein